MMDSSQTLAAGTALQSSKQTYVIERALGQGGFGITYLATTEIYLGQISAEVRVAVKELFLNDICERTPGTTEVTVYGRKTDQAEASRKDFIAEARRLEQVSGLSRNIVKVSEVFETNNTAYYVMEYLDGRSLTDYIRERGRLSADEVRTIIAPIARALSVLHANRMTHLDVKPDNIMLAREKDGGIRPVLIDFGLAKHYDDKGHATSTINTMGFSEGYAPIEQYAGIKTFSPATDVYSLGATMFHALTGIATPPAVEISPEYLVEELDAAGVPTDLRDLVVASMAALRHERPLLDSPMWTAWLEGKAAAPSSFGRATQRMTPPAGIGRTTQRMDAPAHAPAATTIIPEAPAEPTEPAKPRSRKALWIATAAAAVFFAIIIFFALRPDSPVEAMAIDGHTTPQNLDLCAISGGNVYYFTPEEWNAVPNQDAYIKKGIYLANDTLQFIVPLDEDDALMDWEYAVYKYGKNLPDASQGKVITDNIYDLDLALKNFGGTPFNAEPKGWYWTSSPKEWSPGEISKEWANIISIPEPGDSARAGVAATYMVNPAKARPILHDATDISERPKATSDTDANLAGHATPQNFELCAIKDDQARYFTQSEWNTVKDKDAYFKAGIFISENGLKFLLNLKETPYELTWGEAVTEYGNHMPTLEQGRIMANNYEAINQAIIAFGGDKNPRRMYWTNKEYDNNFAWYIGMGCGAVDHGYYDKETRARVRLVKEVL